MTDSTRPPMAVMLGIFAVAAGGVGYGFYNKAVNYELVSAVVEKAERRCFRILKGGSKREQIYTSWKREALLDSNRIRCHGFPETYGEHDNKQSIDSDYTRHDFMFLWYHYTSPKDSISRRKFGFVEIANNRDKIKAGDTLPVQAHKHEAEVTFIDTGMM
jgi:hypothetical protein